MANNFITEGIECKVCGNKNPEAFTLFKEKGKYKIVECDSCSFVFIPPYYRKDVSYVDYKSEEVLEHVRAGNDWIKIQRHKLRYQLIKKYKKEGNLFDLGVGWGHFLYTGKLLGYDTYGIELAQYPYTYAKEDLKLDVDKIDFFDIAVDEKYDILTMWDVLEHIDDCDAVIDKAKKMIKPNGYLILQVPQIDSYFAKKLDIKWTLMGLDHVNYFSRKTITKLLEDRGFEVKKIKSSFEFKLFIMNVLFPMLKLNKKKKGKAIKTDNSSASRQEYYNKTVNKPMWMLKTMVFIHNILYNFMSFLRIGEEMIVVAKLPEAE